jgi:hypothetical protein
VIEVVARPYSAGPVRRPNASAEPIPAGGRRPTRSLGSELHPKGTLPCTAEPQRRNAVRHVLPLLSSTTPPPNSRIRRQP